MPKPAKKRIPRKASKKPSPKRPRFDTVNAPLSELAPRAARPLKFALKIGRMDDPFWIDPDTIPQGVALQWATCSVVGEDDHRFLDEALAGGWNLVPDQQEKNGLILMWAPQEVAYAKQKADIDRAQKQISEIRQLFGMDGKREGHDFPLVSNTFMASSHYERVPSDAAPLDVNVTVKMRLNGHFQDAASSLQLTPEVYAQRRLDLYLRGSLGGIILPSGGAIELIESGNFQLIARSGAGHV